MLIIRGIRGYDEFVNRVILALPCLFAGHPLDREGRPIKRMADGQIVEKGSVLLPDLVLLVDGGFDALFVKHHVLRSGH